MQEDNTALDIEASACVSTGSNFVNTILVHITEMK